MRPYSLTRRLILTVLLLEMALALSTTGANLLYQRRQRLRTFDIMLHGRADSLLGAVQDSEDANDEIILNPKALDLERTDLWEIREPSGRIVSRSERWSSGLGSPALETALDASPRSRSFKLRGEWYRGIAIHGVRNVDADDKSPGVARPVLIFYAASLRSVAHSMWEAARFLLIANSLLLLLTGGALFVLLRRGLRPLEELSQAAGEITPLRWQFKAPPSASNAKELSVLASALDSAMLRLERSLRQQQAFVHDAAHELKTAVTVVKSSLQLLSSRPRTATDYAIGLESCLADCGRMEELVHRMLTLARFEQPDARSNGLPVTTDLCARVREVCLQAETLAELERVKLLVEIPAHATVRLSAEALDTLLSNLVMNALQHTPEDGLVQVRVTMDGPTAVLLVEDTGMGIGPEELPHLFERFYRGDPSRSRRTGGTGLGLAIAKAIVESCDGSIEIDSELGSGTRVTVKLPLVPSSGILQESRLASSAQKQDSGHVAQSS